MEFSLRAQGFYKFQKLLFRRFLKGLLYGLRLQGVQVGGRRLPD